ncbi:MAG: hypothetical protein ACREID_10190, partial [Planctomycetota bacterium]
TGKAPQPATSLPLEDVEEAIREGPLLPRDALQPRRGEKLQEFGDVVAGYSFEHGGATYRYAVGRPKGFDATRPHAVLLDPGHGTGAKLDAKGKADFVPFFRRAASESGLDPCLVVRSEIVEQIGADGLKGEKPEDYVARVFDELFRDLATRYVIDPDRVYAAGLSQTGFWAWYLGRARADRFAGLVPMSSVTWQVDAHLSNFLSVPVYVLHGSEDRVCPAGQPRATCPAIARLGAPLLYREVAGAGHDGGVWGGLGDGLKWCAERPRERYPKRVSKSLQTKLDGWCYWLRVDELEREGDGRAGSAPTAGIDGELEGETVRLYSEGVRAVTLCLASEMVDLDRPVSVVWNGETVFQGKPERSLATMLELVREKVDWKATFEAALPLRAPGP